MTLASARRTLATGLALTLALTAAGCVRLDTPPPEHPTMSAVQERRQEAALAAARIAAAARRVAPTAEPHVAAALETISDQADAQREALGGVWIAWPEGAPEGVATPGPSPTDDPRVSDAAGVLALLHTDWVASRERALAEPAAPRETLGGLGSGADTEVSELTLDAAIMTSRAAQAAALALALGAPLPDGTDPATRPGALRPPDEAATPGPTVTPDLSATAEAEAAPYPGTDPGEAVATLDAARYGLETAAARSEGEAREVAASEARAAWAGAEALVLAGAPDTRRAAWASGDPAAFPDASAMARAALAPLLPLELTAALGSDAAQRAGHLDAAARTAVALVRLGADPGDAALGALPGVEPDSGDAVSGS